jgi:serine/threonine-protein kinase
MMGSCADLIGQVIDRRFRVERALGKGGMGTVWRVQHVESLQHYALKVLNAGLAQEKGVVQRFLREARAAAALRTRHVVRIVDAQISYVHEGVATPFLVMELLDGGTLERTVTCRGPLNSGEAVWVLGQVARALRAAHEQGIVHRDLKPTNVLVANDEEGEPIVKLCDFGVAKLLPGPLRSALAESSKSTHSEALLGSPMYMAPEQLRDARQVVAATDQWALGLLAYYVLTGRDYFGQSSDLPDLVVRITRDPLPTPSSQWPVLPRTFDAWFQRSCARDPEARFGTVSEQMAALEAALGHPRAIVVRAPEEDEDGRGVTPPDGSRAPTGASVASRPLRLQVALLVASALLSLEALGAWHQTLLPHVVSLLPAPSEEWRLQQKDATAMPEPPIAPSTPAGKPTDDRRTGVVQGDQDKIGAQASSAAATRPTVTPKPTAQSQERPQPSRRAAATRAGPARRARPPASASPPVRQSTGSGSEQLSSGEQCVRSAQCQSGLCIAEVCR